MAEIVTFICVMAWLFAGGWAFAFFMEEIADKEVAGGLLLMCAAFGPFMAGAAWFLSRRQALSGSEKE